MTRTGIKLELDVGDLVSNAGRARGAIASLNEAMQKAQKEGRLDDYGKLAYQKERLQGQAPGFERDLRNLANNQKFQATNASGATVFKMDSEYATALKDLNNSLKKLYGKYDDAIKNGDALTAQGIFPQIQETQSKISKTIGDANTPGMGRGMQDAVKAIGIGQLANALNEGFSRWVGSLDRSGIVSQYGSGDVLGGRISEKRRQANLWGGIAQAGLGILGTAAGFMIGGPGGAMLGGTLGAAGGNAINTALQAGPNKEATAAAYAGLWQQRSGDAMELAALLGAPGGVRDAFREAADAAAEFGYSAEEGMDAIKQAAQQGLGGREAREIAEQVFQYERGTGADRGTLMGITTMSARYGAGDALRSGWGGLGASGMNPGQYNEYLRAMQRIMEDGISKGFIRSSDQVAQNLTMLAHMTGNDPLWQGENAARRIAEMNSGLESSTGLRSASDIIAYRAAQNIAGSGGGYIGAMKVLEGGLTPRMFNEYMRLSSLAEGGGKEGTVERMRQTFNLNYTNADALYSAWQRSPDMSETDLQALINQYSNAPPEAESPELDAAKVTESIKNWWTQTGQAYWDKELPKLTDELRNAVRGYNEATGSDVAIPGIPTRSEFDAMTPEERLAYWQKELEDAKAAGNRDRQWEAERNIFREQEIVNNTDLGKMIQMDEQLMRMYDAFQGMFDHGWTRLNTPWKSAAQKADLSAINNIEDVINRAIYSSGSDPRQLQQAKLVLDAFERIPQDVRERWNTENTVNRLGESGNIDQLLAAINRLIDVEIEKGNITIRYE